MILNRLTQLIEGQGDGGAVNTVAARSGVVVGLRITIAVDREVAPRSGVTVGARVAITVEDDGVDVAPRSGVTVGARASIMVDRAAAVRSGVAVGSRVSVAVDRQLETRSGVVVGTRVGITVESGDVVEARSGVVVGARVTVSVEVPVRVRSGVVLGGRGEFQFWRNLAVRSGVVVGGRDRYVGPGTGIVVEGRRFSANEIREGDTFGVYLPWAGIEGIGTLAHVRSRTARADRDEQDLILHVVPQPDARLVPRMAGGARPGIRPRSSDLARRQAQTERDIDRIESGGDRRP